MDTQIVLGRASEGVIETPVLHSLYRFRHRVFKERLGWEVSSIAGMEYDFYDELDPVHIAACRPSGAVLGTVRLLPTTGPYMLRDVFPQLLRGEEAPCVTDVWEMSRFAIEPPDRSAQVQAVCNQVMLDIFESSYGFARENGVREFVMATSVSVERMLAAAGLRMERFGDGVATRIGKVLSVACRVELSEANVEPLFARMADRIHGHQMANVA